MRPWILALGAVAAAAGLVVLRRSPLRTVEAAEHGSVIVRAAEAISPPAARVLSATTEKPQLPPPIAGLDLAKLGIDDSGVTAPLAGGRLARLTIDPELQETARRLLRAYKLPEAAIVMADPATGDVLVYASHVEEGKPRDLAAEATAPAASVFKVVTGAALVEQAALTPDTKQCYSGGEHDIRPIDLEESPARDRWCTTLAGAMGRSVNTVFARLALKHLKAPGLEEMAKGFGFGEPVPFDVPIAASTLKLPSEPVGFARTAAGFWNSTLSPVESVWISTIVARGGEAPRLRLVREVLENGKPIWAVPNGPAPALRRVVNAETAQALTTMMEHTVAEGTSYRAFRDRSGAPFLPEISVAGKTGTLTDPQTSRFYTWFTGFAPSRPHGTAKPVAIAVLVVNKPTWKIKANVVAREMLRAYFAQQKIERVSKPKVDLVARR
jgi:cell division protein FtsI/penicillin-binding protein 2